MCINLFIKYIFLNNSFQINLLLYIIWLLFVGYWIGIIENCQRCISFLGFSFYICLKFIALDSYINAIWIWKDWTNWPWKRLHHFEIGHFAYKLKLINLNLLYRKHHKKVTFDSLEWDMALHLQNKKVYVFIIQEMLKK